MDPHDLTRHQNDVLRRMVMDGEFVDCGGPPRQAARLSTGRYVRLETINALEEVGFIRLYTTRPMRPSLARGVFIATTIGKQWIDSGKWHGSC